MYVVFAYLKGSVMEDIHFHGQLEFRIENVGYVSVLRNKNYTFEYKKGKETYSFVYVAEGQLQFTFADRAKNLLIKKGDVLFIPKYLPYKVVYLQDNTIIKIIVFDITDDNLPACFQNVINTKSQSMAAIFTVISEDRYRAPLFLAGNAYELIYHLLRKADKQISGKYRKILPVVEEISANYAENHKMEYYASLCNMSESNFRKLFKEYTGKSPVEYRNDIRMNAVHTMLLSGEFTVQEAAYIAGFNNMSFFYKQYHKSVFF